MPAQINIFDEIIVDNFAGGGGASTGIELATGRPVTIAINHDPAAIAMHEANHPYTEHYCESVWDIDPRKACKGRKVALAWFSPDCKHFSKAKGGKPVSKNIRGLAWVAVRWAATVHPRVIILENVEEFKTWGPIKDGYPDITQRGRTFNSFVNALKAHGYTVEWRELRACDYGAPTIRKRFFLIARCDGKPIQWPEPTHAAPGTEAVKNGRLKPWRTAAEIIDWSIPCKSIFERDRPLAENTLRRIARGLQKFVIDNQQPFIVQVNHSGDGFRGQSAEEPLQTITAKHGYGLVTPTLMVNEFQNVGSAPNEPLKTILTGNHHYLITPHITSIGQTGFCADRSRDLREPLNTVVTKQEQCLVMPYLTQYHSYDDTARGQKLDDPLLTLDTSPRYALTCAFMQVYYAGGYKGKGQEPKNPLNTITSKDHNTIITSHLIQLNNHCDGQPVTQPLNTITAGAGHFGEVRAFLLKYYGTGEGQAVTEPLGTVTTKDRFGLVTIQGQDYQIVDIGMRMLEPHELYAAQGFPPDYKIDFDVNGKKYPKSAQVARCGNSVHPPFAEALVRANLSELCGAKIGTMAQLDSNVAI